jgi:hypothetical protein
MKEKGLSFLQNLGLIFIVLKLTNNIDWSNLSCFGYVVLQFYGFCLILGWFHIFII